VLLIGRNRADLVSRYCVRTFSGHAEWVRNVVPSDDGRWLVSCSNDQVSPAASFFQVQEKLTMQTSRIWDFASGETKMELRGHDHVVECAVFAPIIAYPAIRELAGIQVRLFILFLASVAEVADCC